MNTSRITLHALVFAVLCTASLAFATQVQYRHEAARARAAAVPTQVIELPRVEIIGHRSR